MNTKTKVIFAFISIFLVGVASGYFLNRVTTVSEKEVDVERFDRDRRGMSAERQRGRSEQEIRERIQNRISGTLELEQNQEEQFFERMDNYRVQLRNQMRDAREREQEIIRNYYNNFRDDLTGILSDEQLEKLDATMHPDTVRIRGLERRGRR